MATLVKHSTMRRYSAAKLKRARRLFVYINFDRLMDHPEAWRDLPRRLVERGLYAQTTSDTSIRFSLARMLFHLDCRTNRQYYAKAWAEVRHGYEWYHWTSDHPWIWWQERDRAEALKAT